MAQQPTNPLPSRVIDMGAEARKAWGEEWGVPETAYRFSNGKEFKDSGSSGGPYVPEGQ